METQQAETVKKTETLTPREQEIYNMLIDGKTPKEIAYELDITYNTIAAHQKSMYRKLDVQNINEFLTKFRPAGHVSVFPAVEQQKQNRKSLFSKISSLFKKTKKAYFINWYKIGDEYSTYNVKIEKEEIDGQLEECVTIFGTMSGYEYAFAGAASIIFPFTLKEMWKMKAFSFKALGDGNKYIASFPTVETTEGNRFNYVFSTVKDETVTVNINIPGDLVRISDSEDKIKFIQKNIFQFNIHALNPGPYSLKFWDIRTSR
jgi:DNA-binding CsgD family transcriptional regulator